MISDSLGQLLKARRSELNQRFQLARHAYPDLDGATFLAFLEQRVDPLLHALDGRPGQTAVFDVSYGLVLELMGRKLIGPTAPHRWIEEEWERLFPALAGQIAEAPAHVLGALTNALLTIAGTPGARPGEWLEKMIVLGPQCVGPDPLLKLGQLLAWRSGLAHFREGAIEAASVLPPQMALAALGVTGQRSWRETEQKLRADPWFDPAASPGTTAELRVVRQVGAFRGLGGLFIKPPVVRASSSHLLVSSGDGHWLLTADCFGATFHHASSEELDQSAIASSDSEVRGSKVRWREKWYDIPFGNGFSSCAATPTTLALTSGASHNILLLALT